MRNLLSTVLCDFYKISHRNMYPQGTEKIYSTWTPRASRMKDVDEVVVFGNQAFIQEYLVEFFNKNFFQLPKETVVHDYKRIIRHTLGVADPETKHLEDLHDLGYLPLLIKGVAEGTIVPLRTPVLTIENTDPRFFWLTNYIETLISCELWGAYTSATIAREYRKILNHYAMETVGNTDFVGFQGHDFSMRGMLGLKAAIKTGMGHLTQFPGTDCVPAILAAEWYYGANVEKELVGTSIPATEHSVQCTYGDDMAYLENMMCRVHPSGFVSIVSDGYDFWDVIGRVIPALKDKIMARDGRVVIRPDSGDPVKIICGDPDAPIGSLEHKGAVEALWDIFGGTYTDKQRRDGYYISNAMKIVSGPKTDCYRVLDSHIGLIYGDAITLRRAEEICERLVNKGFASTNVVFGIGSYTYQYNTRDTFGFAIKSTACLINGKEKHIFKDPKTDDGIKKSQKGKVHVYKSNDKICWSDGHSLDSELSTDLLKPIFKDGKMLNTQTFSEIRARLAAK